MHWLDNFETGHVQGSRSTCLLSSPTSAIYYQLQKRDTFCRIWLSLRLVWRVNKSNTWTLPKKASPFASSWFHFLQGLSKTIFSFLFFIYHLDRANIDACWRFKPRHYGTRAVLLGEIDCDIRLQQCTKVSNMSSVDGHDCGWDARPYFPVWN